jgi:large subunit ribosomal protein L25
MSESTLQAESRTEFGKGAARRIRRADKVPAVLYGHGGDPVHITLPGHETMLALKHGGTNALLTIVVDGKSQLALPKQVQRDPIKGFLEHVDLILVSKGEKVTVEVPIHVVGQAAPDTMVVTEYNEVSIEAEATHLPESIEVSVAGARAGTQVLAKDLKLPSGARIALDEDTLIVHVTGQITAEALEVELAEAEAELGIEHEESDASAEAAANAEGDDEKSEDA